MTRICGASGGYVTHQQAPEENLNDRSTSNAKRIVERGVETGNRFAMGRGYKGISSQPVDFSKEVRPSRAQSIYLHKRNGDIHKIGEVMPEKIIGGALKSSVEIAEEIRMLILGAR